MMFSVGEYKSKDLNNKEHKPSVEIELESYLNLQTKTTLISKTSEVRSFNLRFLDSFRNISTDYKIQ